MRLDDFFTYVEEKQSGLADRLKVRNIQAKIKEYHQEYLDDNEAIEHAKRLMDEQDINY